MTKKLLDLLCREERPIAAAAAAKVLRIRMRILGCRVSRCVIVPPVGPTGLARFLKRMHKTCATISTSFANHPQES